MSDGPLARRLKAQIAADGPTPLDVYWRAAMTDPEHGYYMGGHPIGAEGDFTTAPEISQIFGELIGLWLVDRWRQAGAPNPFALIELGPGRGQLMADALRAARLDPTFGDAANLILAEAGPEMRAEQAKRLAPHDPDWRDDWQSALAMADDMPIFLVANEFFDALPIRQFAWDGDAWRERLVGCEDDAFAFVAGPPGLPPNATPPDAADPPEGAILEVSTEREDAATAIARQVVASGGAALLIDYGHGTSKLGDSLQAIRDGQPADPLAMPGAADITSHVDFASLGRAAGKAGARPWGPVDQGAFLLALGAEARAEALKRRADAAGAAEIDRAVRRLLHPLAMGSLFKAMAITPPTSPPPPGFPP